MWNDTTGRTFEEIIDNCLNYNEWHEVEIDEFDNTELQFEIIKRFEDNNEIVEIGGTNITFNVLEYEIEKVRPREQENMIRATRVQNINGFVIVYSDGNVTKFIINKSYSSNTLTLLRKINNYGAQLEITENKFDIESDLFFWVVNKVIDFPGITLGQAQNILLELVTGFKGETDDKLAEIVGSGDRIINLISTLTVLLEADNLSRMEIHLNHNGNIYRIKLGINGYIDIDEQRYVGEHMYLVDHLMLPQVILSIFLIVIPDLLTTYDDEISNDEWNNTVKREFLTSIGDTIQRRVRDQLGLIEE
jgi:hypothetical protein